LCQFNLESAQKTRAGLALNGEELPVLYFTQLMAVALGLEPETWGLEDQVVDPWPLLSRFRKTPSEPECVGQGAALTG
jgi:heterodisulfide reductase subunit B